MMSARYLVTFSWSSFHWVMSICCFPEMCLNFRGSSWLHTCSTLKDAGPIRSKSDSNTASTSPLRHCTHTKLLNPTGGLELGILFEPVILSTGILYVPLSAIVNCG